MARKSPLPAAALISAVLPGKALKYKKKFTVKAAKRPKWVRARDRAGNWSKWKKAR
jgi:hypothetical protein